MASSFTPEQIAQILEEFFKTVGTRQYIGARYVPIFGRKGETSIEWDGGEAPYEPLTVVLYQGNSYTSRQYVPAGVAITDATFWAQTGNYNAQIEQYRQTVLGFDGRITTNTEGLANLNTKVDELRIKYGETANPIYYGADPTGAEDSSQAIAACIDANKGSLVWFAPGTYKISEPIKTPHLLADRVSIDFCGARITSDAYLNCFLLIGDDAQSTLAGMLRTYYRNGVFENANAQAGIIIADNYKGAVLENLNVIGFQKGIIVGETANTYPSDTQISECLINYDNTADVDSVGILYNGTDNKLNNCHIVGFHYSIDMRGSGLFVDNVHNLPKGLTNSGYLNELAGAAFVRCAAGSLFIHNSYCDTYQTFVYVTTNAYIEIDSCEYYSYKTPLEMVFVRLESSLTNFTNVINIHDCLYVVRPHPDAEKRNRSIVLSANSNNAQTLPQLIVKNNRIQTSDGNIRTNMYAGDFMFNRQHMNPYWPNNQINASAENPFVCVGCYILPYVANAYIDFELAIYTTIVRKIDVSGRITFNTSQKTVDYSELVASTSNFVLDVGAQAYFDVTNHTIMLFLYLIPTTYAVNTNYNINDKGSNGIFVMGVMPATGYLEVPATYALPIDTSNITKLYTFTNA